MKRAALCALAPLLVSTLACSAYSSGPGPTVAPPGRFDMAVDAGAYVNHPSLRIRPGETGVVWSAPADKVKTLWVAFKPDTGSEPADPVCQGATCTLPAASTVGKDNVFYYVVGVKLKNNKWKIRDPMLIIKP